MKDKLKGKDSVAAYFTNIQDTQEIFILNF